MTNFKPLIKRVGAYIIDLFLVLTFASLITNSPILNKNMESYRKTYDEYATKYNDYADYLTLLDESYKDEEINEEEYNKLIENETYKEIITSKYDDTKITKEEYKEVLSKINEEFNLVAKEYVYLLSQKGAPNSVTTLICTLLYFGVIQYFLKGQTLGKKLLKLKVVSASDKKINIINYILRSLVVNDVLLNTISVLFLLLSSQKVYTQADNIIGILVSIVEATIIFMIFTREDKRGLHDLLFNTKVISTDENKEVLTIESPTTFELEEKTTKSTKTNKKKRNQKKENNN